MKARCIHSVAVRLKTTVRLPVTYKRKREKKSQSLLQRNLSAENVWLARASIFSLVLQEVPDEIAIRYVQFSQTVDAVG